MGLRSSGQTRVRTPKGRPRAPLLSSDGYILDVRFWKDESGWGVLQAGQEVPSVMLTRCS